MANPHLGHQRAQRLYRNLPPCKCGAKAERHHRDGNQLNNHPSNLLFVCRRCHMTEDGRLSRLLERNRHSGKKQPPKPCVQCQREAKPLRRGLCSRCFDRKRRPAIPAEQRRAICAAQMRVARESLTREQLSEFGKRGAEALRRSRLKKSNAA